MNFRSLAGVTAVASLCVLSAGCATKRYPMATELSPAQAELMTCRELMLAKTEIDQVEAKITDTATTDWRSVAGFLGDYGIGNAMAKSEAEKALSDRKMSIDAAMVSKRCGSINMMEKTGADS